MFREKGVINLYTQLESSDVLCMHLSFFIERESMQAGEPRRKYSKMLSVVIFGLWVLFVSSFIFFCILEFPTMSAYHFSHQKTRAPSGIDG